mmetsp:Transcript_27812/g.65693  ORF Transcript_27812/g.65693 Transcript_27812/m.65693 type:complete len:481 (+) Transcript_27812:713-2155(+)
MARSISTIMPSCRFCSCAYRSRIRWISRCIARTSAAPTSGSSAACVSRSRAIFFSRSVVCFCASTVSSSSASFSSLSATILASLPTASSSSSLSRATNSVSVRKFSSARLCCRSPCSDTSRLILPISVCIESESRASRTPSRFSAAWVASMRTRVCSRMERCARLSCRSSATSMLRFCTVTSSVWFLIHARCSSPPSACTLAISFLRCTMVASSGPASSSMSSTPARAFMSPSNFRLSRSRSCAFFSTSVLRRRLSASYLAMSASFSTSSALVDLSCAASWPLCETVLSASTLRRASSFCSCACAISLSCTPSRTLSASLAVLAVPFSTAICSPRLAITASSIFFASSNVRCRCVSIAATSAVSVECCWLTLLSSMSVCSSDLLSIANFSLCCSSVRRTSAWPAMTIFISASSLFCVATRVSFFSCSFLIIFLSPRTSPSIACSCSRCLCRAFSVACSASSRLCMPSSALFHCASSCFFS